MPDLSRRLWPVLATMGGLTSGLCAGSAVFVPPTEKDEEHPDGQTGVLLGITRREDDDIEMVVQVGEHSHARIM